MPLAISGRRSASRRIVPHRVHERGGARWSAPKVSVRKDRYRPCPAGTCGADFRRETNNCETLRRQTLEVVKLFDLAVTDLASCLMTLPDEAGVAGLGKALRRVRKRRVPTPAVCSDNAHAFRCQVQRRCTSH